MFPFISYDNLVKWIAKNFFLFLVIVCGPSIYQYLFCCSLMTANFYFYWAKIEINTCRSNDLVDRAFIIRTFLLNKLSCSLIGKFYSVMTFIQNKQKCKLYLNHGFSIYTSMLVIKKFGSPIICLSLMPLCKNFKCYGSVFVIS